MLRFSAVLVVLATSLSAQSPRLGTISFPTSGAPSAQQAFLEGVLFLHSFEYPSAAAAFKRAQARDPGFAMAYWGEAMTYTHPVWDEQDIGAARTALARLAPTAAARQEAAPTSREREYLAAVEALYGEGSKPRRDTLYANAMERVVRAHPDDFEAKAFYALALLGLNQGVRDTTTYLRAAAYADTVFAANSDHPGGAHYLIHAFDDPVHAARGLAAARAYSRIAPDAAHAQHMTTHIFLALGMWDEVVSQNRVALARQAQLPGHYSGWLAYALLQLGRYSAAESLLTVLRANLAAGGAHTQHTAWADMRSHYLLHTERWSGAIAAARDAHDRMTVTGELSDAYTQGVIGFRMGDGVAVGTGAMKVARLVSVVGGERGQQDPATGAARVMAGQLEGMRLVMAGDTAAGLRALAEAARLEDALPMEFGPPAIEEPTHELLGSLLLALDPKGAQAEFQRGLALAPGRSRGLLGLVRASLALRDREAAAAALDRLERNWKNADPAVRASLAPLREALARIP